MNTKPYMIQCLNEILDAVNSSLDDKAFRELAECTSKAALSCSENHWVYNENPNLFWGYETMFVVNALKAYAEIQKDSIKKIEAQWKTPMYTLDYMDQMSEQIIGKILQLHQPRQPEEKEDK